MVFVNEGSLKIVQFWSDIFQIIFGEQSVIYCLDLGYSGFFPFAARLEDDFTGTFLFLLSQIQQK